MKYHTGPVSLRDWYQVVSVVAPIAPSRAIFNTFFCIFLSVNFVIRLSCLYEYTRHVLKHSRMNPAHTHARSTCELTVKFRRTTHAVIALAAQQQKTLKQDISTQKHVPGTLLYS